MTKWLITLRFRNGAMINIYEQFAYENPTEEEIDKLLQKNSDYIHGMPIVIFMQKLYRR